MKIHLVQTGSAPYADHIVIDHLPFVVGRSRSCDGQVYHPMVSRQHCTFKEEDGTVAVEDLHSSNGTFINGHRVREKAVVHDGDEINLGCVAYRVALPPSSN